jgi:leucyl aminopeptidase (aminopeptidase T)
MVVLPAGGTEVDVVPFTANGTVVFEAYHMFGRLSQPMTLKLVDGYVKKIEGGYEARILRKLFKEKEDSDYLLHIGGPGTNPYGRCPGLPELIEDKHSEGPQHVGFGGGAKLTSEMHSDGIIYKPTIVADGKIVQEDGVIKFPLFEGE